MVVVHEEGGQQQRQREESDARIIRSAANGGTQAFRVKEYYSCIRDPDFKLIQLPCLVHAFIPFKTVLLPVGPTVKQQ